MANKTVSITAMALQANTDRKVYVKWKFSAQNTDHYNVTWVYGTGQGTWFDGMKTTTTSKQSVWDAPSNAKKVKVTIKPVSKKNKNGKSYWTGGSTSKQFSSFKTTSTGKPTEPTQPSTPTINIDGDTLTANVSYSGVGNAMEFEIVKDNRSVFVRVVSRIAYQQASIAYGIEPGHKYKVRCRAGSMTLGGNSLPSILGVLGIGQMTGTSLASSGPWSDYSSEQGTAPGICGSAPSVQQSVTLQATSPTEVLVTWPVAAGATEYEVQAAQKSEYFDAATGEVKTYSITSGFKCYATGLESGVRWYFRVRGKNSYGTSAWTNVESIVIGKPPAAPTTWSSTTTAIVGESLILYWVHNSEDGSKAVSAELELATTISGKKTTEIKTVDNPNWNNPNVEDTNASYALDTNQYKEGVKIEWRVRTKGITGVFGDWSIQRTVYIYARPSLSLLIEDIYGNRTDFASFPISIKGQPGPITQNAIGYHVSIKSLQNYETVDNVGNVKWVSSGEEIYSKYMDASGENLSYELTPFAVTFENGMEYVIECTVSMDSGLTATNSQPFTVIWDEELYEPDAEIVISDYDAVAANIRPYCSNVDVTYYRVDIVDEQYVKTETEITDLREIHGQILDGVSTTTGEEVFSGTSLGIDRFVTYCEVYSEEEFVPDVVLSVYRREYDGSFVEIATGMENDGTMFATDPHPALDYARYRIVVMSTTTGAMNYSDMPGVPIGVTDAIFQWDEEWKYLDNPDIETMEASEPTWSGSVLRLPFNVDVSEKRTSDVALVEYIGRKHPVSYYGTQIGETHTLNVEIDKKDAETLFAIRRLSAYMGDVYFREPSGVGYWANVSVSFSRKHVALTVPIAFEIKRVEGGI